MSETMPVRKMTIMKELKIENQWICAPQESRAAGVGHGALARCCAALGGHADLVLEKVVVEVAVEAAVEGGTCR